MDQNRKQSFDKLLSGFILNYKWYFGIVILIAVAVSLQHYIYTPPERSIDAKYNYTHYNNYLIFKQSFFHLIEHKDLFAFYPNEYYDLYKYTPTFALLMAPFAYLPNLAGLILWNILNAFMLFMHSVNFHLTMTGKNYLQLHLYSLKQLLL